GVRTEPDRRVPLPGGARGGGRLPGGRDRPRGRAGGPVPVTYWCEQAWLPEGVTAGVLVEIDGPRITRVARGEPGGAHRLPGLTIPGMADAHSHAFHRALRARTQTGRGAFWTWRDRMYEVAARLDPDTYLGLARAVYAEMALAGITCVGEFHYLHHAPGGAPYADPNAMGHA